jgi:hypothetical protein
MLNDNLWKEKLKREISTLIVADLQLFKCWFVTIEVLISPFLFLFAQIFFGSRSKFAWCYIHVYSIHLYFWMDFSYNGLGAIIFGNIEML